MPTGQTIINNALTALGILDQGGTPSVSDSTDALAELNAMWDAWSIDPGLIYSILTFNGNLVTATASYTIGTGATFNTPRPTKIFRATFSVANNRNPLDIVPAERYYSHNDLTASAATPDEMYADYNVDATGYAKLYFWPVPTFVSGAPQVELQNGVPFSAWTLGGSYLIPYGYQDAIQYALAWRLIPRYGAAVAQQVAEVIRELGQKSEERLRMANAANLQMSMPGPGGGSPGSPITTPSISALQGLQPGR